jgi:hypothetical protein
MQHLPWPLQAASAVAAAVVAAMSVGVGFAAV